MKVSHSHSRRGVLLLVVLGLLAMFGLVAVAFVVLTGQALRSAQTVHRIGQYDERAEETLDEFAMQALRGRTNPTDDDGLVVKRASVLGPHSLLEDIYSNATIQGKVTAVQWVNGYRQLVEFEYQLYDEQMQTWDDDDYPQRRPGCVLTMTSGTAAGQSTHIVGYDRDEDELVLVAFAEGEPAQGDTFIINGAPFSGTGVGFDPDDSDTDGKLLDAADSDGVLFALRPNPVAPSVDVDQNVLPVEYLEFWKHLRGDDQWNTDDDVRLNEPYDAADFQNMLLAAQVETDAGVATLPSLHRPGLINYGFHQLADYLTTDPSGPSLTPEQAWSAILQPYGRDYVPGTLDDTERWPFDPTIADAIVALKRKLILRPLPEDHPRFSGSNPSSRNLLRDPDTGELLGPYWERGNWGVWDVDNDGDGTPDGIWVDAGLPVRSAPDGRLFRPLVSFLVLDLDGRLNLNAHGCLAQKEESYYGQVDRDNEDFQLPSGHAFLLAGDPQTADPNLPRGQGYGPAEINLGPLFGDVATDSTARDAYKDVLESRYGGTNATPGDSGDDVLSRNTWYGYRGNYWSSTNTLGFVANPGAVYGTPPNPKAGGAIALDPSGRPIYAGMCLDTDSDGQEDEKSDDPYELNLSQKTRWDRPFMVAELERILRPYDVDAHRLPGRLASLVDQRRKATTESWDLPCPGSVLSADVLLAGLDPADPEYNNLLDQLPARHLTDVLGALLIKKGADSNDVTTMLPYLFPPEMLAGLKMDLNRPWGNWADDNNNAVIDEWAENDFVEQVPLVDAQGNLVVDQSGNPIYVDHGNDGGTSTITARDMAARQLYARHLYVLMLLLIDDYVDPAWVQAYPGISDPDELRARVAAQWAVNVVDFRDRDSIMTFFEYDIYPFTDVDSDDNPWDVDGDLSTQDGPYPVWGCERPELLITETLAFHDRRTENLSADGGEYDTNLPEDQRDDNDDYDQRIRPQGSLFIELYNPWTNQEPTPGEFRYDRNNDGVPEYPGVDLARMAGTSPVWRLIIVEPEQADTTDPDDPVEANRPTIDRSIYFVDPTGNAELDQDDGRQYYPNPDPQERPPLAPIKPGRYAVIGPGGEPEGGAYTTYLGFRAGATGNLDDRYSDPSTRRIALSPNLDPETNQVEVFSDGSTNDLTSRDVQPAVAVVINFPGILDPQAPQGTNEGDPKWTRPLRLSVSEPTGGYPLYVPDDETATEYNPIQPSPVDNPQSSPAQLWKDGTSARFRIVYLQRLANPLLEYDSKTNPYRTIDSMQIDLTAFNGVTSYTQTDPKRDPDVNFGQYDFYTRERGEDEESATAGDDPDPTNNLWARQQITLDPPTSANPQQAPADHRFTKQFAHTLGYLNEGYWPLFEVNPNDLLTRYGPDNIYRGGPRTTTDPYTKPFPWLTWNNRPFVSQLELLLVPPARSYGLLREYGLSPASPNYYAPTSVNEMPYRHLLNFFQSGQAGQTGISPQLHRLLEFVHVPSRFVGTELLANPAMLVDGNHAFHPPFNRISRYREPGRINLNTIYSKEVFEGLMNGHAGSDVEQLWKKFRQTRRGYGGEDDGILQVDSAYPTLFKGLFRSFGGGSMVPLSTLKPNREVSATLLRPRPDDATRPLFEYSSTDAATNTQRNPYFRYLGLERLGNLVTTRSNVYALWITVGYFEVEPNPAGIDTVHPDGFRLGQEMGVETGEVKRHRAFYVVDRSIPVGFQRGKDHNVEKAILLKRFIE